MSLANAVRATVLELLELAELARRAGLDLSAGELARWPNRRSRVEPPHWWSYANRQRWSPAYKGDVAPVNAGLDEPPPVPYDVAWRNAEPRAR